ncbi:hypothetical protein Hanom_Chr17g01527791 [Helianthus anomalus]
MSTKQNKLRLFRKAKQIKKCLLGWGMFCYLYLLNPKLCLLQITILENIIHTFSFITDILFSS